jgi:hypothetical protein
MQKSPENQGFLRGEGDIACTLELSLLVRGAKAFAEHRDRKDL